MELIHGKQFKHEVFSLIRNIFVKMNKTSLPYFWVKLRKKFPIITLR